MPARTYTGPHAAVEIRMPDGTTRTVEKGATEDLPAEVIPGLDASGDWAAPGGESGPTKADLVKQAEESGITLPAGAKKADIETLLADHTAAGEQSPETGEDTADGGEG